MFRFTIRDMLWLTVVVAVVIAWVVDRRRVERGCENRVATIRAHAELLRASLWKCGAAAMSDIDWTLTDKPIPP